MPATYWLPLPDLREWVPAEYLHAAFSRWFDIPGQKEAAPKEDAHYLKVKPYRLSPLSRQDGVWGVEVSLLSEEAFLALRRNVSARPTVRLGRHVTVAGIPQVLAGETWADLAEWHGDNEWRVTFLTPFAFRTGNRTSPFPSPAVVLRAPTESWAKYSGFTPIKVSPADQVHLWVNHVEISTTKFQLNGHSHPGVVGEVSYRADTPQVARLASSLFRLARYCGMGSFRGKGMGVVSVESRTTTTRDIKPRPPAPGRPGRIHRADE